MGREIVLKIGKKSNPQKPLFYIIEKNFVGVPGALKD